ncbi:MAG: DNA polymerase III subunit alpha [Gemmatimonas sp.]
MAHADFVHLRVHTAYSLLEGAIKIPDLAKLCVKKQMPAVAITDTRNLFGALEFSDKMAGAGVQPIIGCQLGLVREGGNNVGRGQPVNAEPDKLVLLTQNDEGWRNLIALVSKAHLSSEAGATPTVTLADVLERAPGLIALTAGPEGPVGRALLEGRNEAAEETLLALAKAFDNRLFVEISRLGVEAEGRTEAQFIDLAYKHGLPLVATNEAFFATADMYEAHDALLCIAQGLPLAEPNRRRLTPDHRFKSAEEMRALFADLPEAVDNTLLVAKRTAFMARPRKPILPAFPVSEGRTEAEEVTYQAEQGLKARLEKHVFTPEMDEAAREQAAKPYWERLGYELGIIKQMGFPGYFLIVSDFIKWAKAQGIPVGPGRGSGAGSVVAWALTITDLDPLRFNLLFERFLNPERVSMPDFDVDFCQDRRDEVIKYVQDKYGHDRVAQIITFGKLQARAVLRDVGRVLGLPYGQVDRICKLVPNNPANPISLEDAIEGEPQLQEMRDQDPEIARLMDIALRLEGLYRHASTHAAGVVIGDRPLDQLVPMYRDPRSPMPVTQFNMKYVEQAGLVKFDFLGLKTLTVLQRAVELVQRHTDLTLATIPLDDRKTYDLMASGATTGVFQLESSGMRDVLRRLKPDVFEDIIALVALYRPGPMDQIPRYISCKHGKEQPDYLYPSLEWILKETFGVMIYQEQVMQIAQELAGYSLGGADLLRRAMGKKIKSEMDEQRRIFVEGAVARSVPKAKAEYIFEQVDKFAGYGFNKSHAAAYALVAYQTAYLKANHPVEFLAASMTLDMGNTDKLGTFRQELQRLGIQLLPPDVNKSDPDFAVEETTRGNAIRYALGAVRNVGIEAMRVLTADRRAKGAFKTLFDLAERLDQKAINKRLMESLAAAGAFDSLERSRAKAFAAAEILVQIASRAAADRASNQVSLFGNDPAIAARPALPAVQEWTIMERLRREFEAIGFYLSAHPLDAYAKSLARLRVSSSVEVMARVRASESVRLAGTVVGKKERTSARGTRFAFVQLSDMGGMYEVTVFSEVLSAARELLEAGRAVLVTADAKREGEGVRMIAQRIQPLDEAVAGAAPAIRVHVAEPSAMATLKAAIAKIPRGKSQVSLVVDVAPDREVEIQVPGGFALTPAQAAEFATVPGVLEVVEV